MSTPESPQVGPCTAWISGEDVLASDCADLGTDTELADDVAQKASDILFELSGHKFAGLCERTVRPCECVGCPPVVCWCCSLSAVKLAGTVREVSEVLIDGDLIDPSEYRVDKRKYLVRLADTDGNRQSWPGWQRLDLATTETATFSVTYSYGIDPPLAGVNAALELACQLAAAATGGECLLPAGTTKVTRQGVTVEIGQLQAGLAMLPETSLFLETYNPNGLRRKPYAWSPDVQPYAQKVGP